MKKRVVRAQPVSRMCLVCGTQNAAGLKTAFYELEDGELMAVFTAAEQHQGYPGRVHGGVLATVLDEAIGRAINTAEPDAWGVTVELSHVRYKQPVPLGETIRVIARITSNSSRIFEGSGEVVLPDGTVAVEAQGRYMKLPISRIASGDFSEEWFDDPRPAPDTVEL